MFTNEPDIAPYIALAPDIRIFDPKRVRLGHAPPVKMDEPQ